VRSQRSSLLESVLEISAMKPLTVRQAAERLGLACSTVYLLCQQQKIVHLRVGGRGGAIRITEESLAAYVAGATIQPQMPAGPPPPKLTLKHLRV
jgi:excisionase family DNA binding protein